MQVILGGGRQYMLPKSTFDPEYPTDTGDRSDGRNLIQEWSQNKKVIDSFTSSLLDLKCAILL